MNIGNIGSFSPTHIKQRGAKFRKQKNKFSSFTAQIIQHEMDHCNGILI